MSDLEMADSKNVGKGMSGLVVDDDTVTQMIHKVLLEKYGLETKVVKNGEEAVALHRAGARFDIVLMDKEMPVKDGVNATRELREMGVTSKIIGVTTHGPGAIVDEFMAAGLDECLTKPLSPDIVLHLILRLTKA